MGDLLFDAAGPDGVVGLEDGLLEFIVDPALFPTKFLEVLGPLEVGYDHPSGIDQDIQQNRDTALAKDAVGLRRDGVWPPPRSGAP